MRNGFTLIELLIVLAIFSVTMAIIVPTFSMVSSAQVAMAAKDTLRLMRYARNMALQTQQPVTLEFSLAISECLLRLIRAMSLRWKRRRRTQRQRPGKRRFRTRFKLGESIRWHSPRPMIWWPLSFWDSRILCAWAPANVRRTLPVGDNPIRMRKRNCRRLNRKPFPSLFAPMAPRVLSLFVFTSRRRISEGILFLSTSSVLGQSARIERVTFHE